MSNLIKFSTFFAIFLLMASPLALADQFQLKKVSELQLGEIILDEQGNEILINTITESNYNFWTNLKDLLSGKKIITGMVTINPPTETSSSLSRLFDNKGTDAGKYGLKDISMGGFADSLLSGVQWAAIAYLAGQFLGPLLGLDDDQTNSLSISLAAGAGVFSFLDVATTAATDTAAGGFLSESTFFTNPIFGMSPAFVIGIAVAVIVFIATYSDTKIEQVSFECQPWQAPKGGNDCEVCNEGDLPCSEYRCRSLGQSCEIVNKGTEDEKCVYVNPKDVQAPVITPDSEKLKERYGEDYKFTNVSLSPPGPGFTINYDLSKDGCIPAFTPLEFAIKTDEPSTCKIDFEHKETMQEMRYTFGGSNFLDYSHTERFSLPGPGNLKKENITLENGGEWIFYIRCADAKGNENVADYALRFCVDPSPDTTPPIVAATSIKDGGCVAANTDSANVTFYLNEPSQCKWSTVDQNYEDMQNKMTCLNRLEQINSKQLYACKADLGGISREGSNYFIRCEDNEENKMATSFPFTLKGSSALLIATSKPNETVFGGVNPAPVELHIETSFGCNDNQAICFYSFTGEEGDYTMFYDTNTIDGIHTQRLDLTDGEKKVFLECVDEGGNKAKETLNFNVEIDTNAPAIARLYEESGKLKILTMRESVCAYTNEDCNFLISEGIEMPYANSTAHIIEWNKDEIYYIKCRDEYQNEEATCSAIVKPTKNFL